MGVDLMVVGFGLCLVMVVELAVLLQQGNARGGVHHRQLREGVHHVLQVAFHARPVDEEYIRLRQGFHVAGLQLVIVQAARSRGGQVVHLQAVDALGQVQGKQINGIKGSGHRFAQGAQGQGEQEQGKQKSQGLLHGYVPFLGWCAGGRLCNGPGGAMHPVFMLARRHSAPGDNYPG